jgi:GNAT superfamily N-acetyltransferase
MDVEIRILSHADAGAARARLAEILTACVAGGASINFMASFTHDDALTWWDGAIAGIATGSIILFGAYLDDELVGSAQLGLDRPPNQQHRADVKKVIVHPHARQRGIGAALMEAVEAQARRDGLELLTLDTATGSPAERLYARLGWQRAGIIPRYALMPDGSPCDTTFFWKEL